MSEGAPMRQRTLLALAIVSIAGSIWLGSIDREVHTASDLFTFGNMPALVIFAAVIFTTLLVATIGVIGTVKSIRGRMRPH